MTVPSFPLQLRSGNTAECDAHTGELAEVTVDTEAKNLRLHDGVTPGGLVIGAVDLSGYSLTNHNHDAAYAAIGHNHDSAYAALGHNHDTAYAALGHNHDSAYAAAGHDHSGTYEPANANIQTHIGTTTTPHVTSTEKTIWNGKPSLGTTSSTAYQGDRGEKAYHHAYYGYYGGYSRAPALNASDVWHLGTNKVLEAHISAGAVTNLKIGSGAVTNLKIGSGAVKAGNLSTGQSEVYSMIGGGSSTTISGGQYCHWPQIKVNSAAGIIAQLANGFSINSYTTSVYTDWDGSPEAGDSYYINFLYHASSGPIFWLFELRDKATGKVLKVTYCPDHVSYGNGGNPQAVPHPFPDFDPVRHDITLVTPPRGIIDMLHASRDGEEEEQDDRFFALEELMKYYEVDENKSEPWPDIPVTTGIRHKGHGLWLPHQRIVSPVPYINVLGLRKKEAGK